VLSRTVQTKEPAVVAVALQRPTVQNQFVRIKMAS
jgi:hypothetical protein